MDYYGLSYEVVEVDPVLRKEIDWSDYKKVPILLTKVSNGYVPLNDSSMIVSVLTSYLQDKSKNMEELASYYPMLVVSDEKGESKNEIANKYFLMYQNTLPQDRTMDSIT